MVPYIFKNSLVLFLMYSLLVVASASTPTHSTAELCHDHERSALLHFKQSLSLSKSASESSSAYPKTESWKHRGEGSTDCCSWSGVECNNNTGYVIGLYLSSSLLYGTLPSNSTIFALIHLQTLHLDDNNFNYSPIPLGITHLLSLSSLDLSFSVFSGKIPLELSGLSKLTFLDLSGNKLSGNLPHGNIPLSLANLTQLSVLNLGSNHFSGEIPLWLTNMSHLTYLALTYNNLTGPIPNLFSQLKNLEYLGLHKNNLIGTVEADIFLNLTELTYLSLSYNNITLLTHHHINSTLSKLQTLQLSACNLEEIPHFLQFQNDLKLLFLNGNNIHGKIPHWIWNASDYLEAIDLSGNFLTAMEQNLIAIPGSRLAVIDLSYNMLQGNLPVLPPNTINFDISNNNLTGNIPPKICGSMSLLILDLSYNNMSGPIPQCLAYSLGSLVLGDNNFSGTIPQIYPKKCNLRVLDVGQNQLIERVPKSLVNCKMLQIIDLSNNLIEQTLPMWLGTLPQLQVLLLRSNRFYGAVGSPTIPTEFPMLRIIDLSQNFLIGDLPVDYIKIWNSMKVFSQDTELYINTAVQFETQSSEWTSSYPMSITLTYKGVKTKYEKIQNIFTSIDLSSNKFTGYIPESLGSLEALESLSLSNNELTGTIPPSLGNLRQLESLDLSHNKLSGYIPQQLAEKLNFLAFFNVSYNLLTGHIPQGPQFKTFDKSSYMMNSGLCGFPLSKTCGTAPSVPADDGDEDEDESDADGFLGGYVWVFILAGLGSGLVVGTLMGNILVDRHPWLIAGVVQNFGGTLNNRRRPKRQNIWD